MSEKNNSLLKKYLEIIIIPLALTFIIHYAAIVIAAKLYIEREDVFKFKGVLRSTYESEFWRLIVLDNSTLVGVMGAVTALIIANSISPSTNRSINEYSYITKLSTVTRLISLIGYFLCILHINSIFIFYIRGVSVDGSPSSVLFISAVAIAIFHFGFYSYVPDARRALQRFAEIEEEQAVRKLTLVNIAQEVAEVCGDDEGWRNKFALNSKLTVSSRYFKTGYLVRENRISLLLLVASSLVWFGSVFADRDNLNPFAIATYYLAVAPLCLFLVIIYNELLNFNISIRYKRMSVGPFDRFLLFLGYLFLILFASIVLITFSLPLIYFSGHLVYWFMILSLSLLMIGVILASLKLKSIYIINSLFICFLAQKRVMSSLDREMGLNQKIIDGESSATSE